MFMWCVMNARSYRHTARVPPFHGIWSTVIHEPWLNEEVESGQAEKRGYTINVTQEMQYPTRTRLDGPRVSEYEDYVESICDCELRLNHSDNEMAGGLPIMSRLGHAQMTSRVESETESQMRATTVR